MIFSIIVAKIVSKFLRFIGRGATTLPGRVALRLCPDILHRLARGVHIICVTGTNGKTTTCAIISHALRSGGYSYIVNNSGANMLTGITTTFIMNSTITGRCRCQYAVLECDENSLPIISSMISADYLVVTNIFRDQLDRYGEVNNTLDAIRLSASNMPQCQLILNGDCPLTYSLSRHCDNPVLSFSVSMDDRVEVVSDSPYCPICGGVLVYDSRSFAQLGRYHCISCSYRHPQPYAGASDVVAFGQGGMSFLLRCGDRSQYVTTSLGGSYNVYNFTAAYAVLCLLDVENTSSLSTFNGAFGRMERFSCGKNNILLLLVKNPVGLANCVRYVSQLSRSFNICFALNDNDADGKDVSWIWDASLSPLCHKSCKVYTTGTRAYDMAVRLKYDGIPSAPIIGEDYEQLIDIARSGSCDLVVLSTYTSMMKMRRLFVKAFGGNDFWLE